MILFSGVGIGSQEATQGQDAGCRNVGVLAIWTPTLFGSRVDGLFFLAHFCSVPHGLEQHIEDDGFYLVQIGSIW